MYTETQDTDALENWFQVDQVDAKDGDDDAPAKPARAGRARSRDIGDATDMYVSEIGRAKLLTAGA